MLLVCPLSYVPPATIVAGGNTEAENCSRSWSVSWLRPGFGDQEAPYWSAWRGGGSQNSLLWVSKGVLVGPHNWNLLCRGAFEGAPGLTTTVQLKNIPGETKCFLKKAPDSNIFPNDGDTSTGRPHGFLKVILLPIQVVDPSMSRTNEAARTREAMSSGNQRSWL